MGLDVDLPPVEAGGPGEECAFLMGLSGCPPLCPGLPWSPVSSLVHPEHVSSALRSGVRSGPFSRVVLFGGRATSCDKWTLPGVWGDLSVQKQSRKREGW